MKSGRFFLILTVSTILNAAVLFSQEPRQVKIDSFLFQLDKTKDDTNKVNLLIRFSRLLVHAGEDDRAIQYADHALALAEKLKFRTGQAAAYRIKAYLDSNLDKQLQFLDRSILISKEAFDTIRIYNCFIQKGQLCRSNERYPEALFNFLEAFKIAESGGNKSDVERSDELLLNILPAEVAGELKEKGSAEARQFDQVTVMFTDFKGFTRISEKLTPAELVAEINTCFKAFDIITTSLHIEKIKTIGDSYMCAGGLPVSNSTHAHDVVRAAIEIQKFMMEHLQKSRNEDKESFEIRIGIHTGPVVAGIVGVKKFAYDIWGDTVNIASRMESSSEAGKINISGHTYQLVKDNFNCTYRGKIGAKNKGEIDMYFVEWES